MSAFSAVFRYKDLYPDLGFFEGLNKVAQNHLYDVLADLPRIAPLPTAAELSAMPEGEIFVLEAGLTVRALASHLSGAQPTTSEFLLSIFRDGTHVVEVATATGYQRHFIWDLLFEKTDTHLHTHPNPTNSLQMREPSLIDLGGYWDQQSPGGAIASHDGLTYVPKPVDDPYDLWEAFEVLNAGVRVSKRTLYSQFVAQVVRPRFAEWTTFAPDMAIGDAVASLA
jgi:hypothetical protein